MLPFHTPNQQRDLHGNYAGIHGFRARTAQADLKAGTFAATNVAAAIMELVDDKPLPQEIFDGQIRQLGPGTMRQPHLRLVQADQVDNDGKIAETEEFSAAT
jgi:hypothetical protein